MDNIIRMQLETLKKEQLVEKEKLKLGLPEIKKTFYIGRAYIPSKTSNKIPANTDVGINDTFNIFIVFFKVLATNKLSNSMPIKLTVPHTLDPQKPSIFISSADVFISVINMHVFECIQALSALQLIYFFTSIYVQFIFP